MIFLPLNLQVSCVWHKMGKTEKEMILAVVCLDKVDTLHVFCPPWWWEQYDDGWHLHLPKWMILLLRSFGWLLWWENTSSTRGDFALRREGGGRNRSPQKKKNQLKESVPRRELNRKPIKDTLCALQPHRLCLQFCYKPSFPLKHRPQTLLHGFFVK